MTTLPAKGSKVRFNDPVGSPRLHNRIATVVGASTDPECVRVRPDHGSISTVYCYHISKLERAGNQAEILDATLDAFARVP